MGTTEESAVDPLTEVLDIRENFSKQVSVETPHLGCGQWEPFSIGLVCSFWLKAKNTCTAWLFWLINFFNNLRTQWISAFDNDGRGASWTSQIYVLNREKQ